MIVSFLFLFCSSLILFFMLRRAEVKSGENDWKTPLPWHRNSCYHGVCSSGVRWTAHFIT